MAHIPDRLTNKTAQGFRNILAGTGLLGGLLTIGAFSEGDVGPGLLVGCISGGALLIASKIKVHYRLKGGVAVYE